MKIDNELKKLMSIKKLTSKQIATFKDKLEHTQIYIIEQKVDAFNTKAKIKIEKLPRENWLNCLYDWLDYLATNIDFYKFFNKEELTNEATNYR